MRFKQISEIYFVIDCGGSLYFIFKKNVLRFRASEDITDNTKMFLQFVQRDNVRVGFQLEPTELKRFFNALPNPPNINAIKSFENA
jgi:hypothetical protein